MTTYERTHDGYPVPSTVDLLVARTELSGFVRFKASETEQHVGFGLTAVPDAPSAYQQLRGAYADSKMTGTPLPVYDQFCDTSIYLEPRDNIRLRFWHDVHHVLLGLSFNLDDELELATWHCLQLELAGFDPSGLGYRLFRTDLVGQIYLMGIAKRFPYNQRRFVETCLSHGFDVGLLDELRFIPDPGAPKTRSDEDGEGGTAGRLGLIRP